MAPPPEPDEPLTGRRPYDSPVRRQRAAETRERILVAASALAHEQPGWDWSALTYRAVAERAGVGERTVYRHFPNQRALNDAVMAHLEAEAGVRYDEVTLDTLGQVTARVFASLGDYRAGAVAEGPDDPTFHEAGRRRRAALLDAVTAASPHWAPAQREAAAAVLDVAWGIPSFEQLVGPWGFERDRASAALTWLIGLVVAAVDADDRPPP